MRRSRPGPARLSFRFCLKDPGGRLYPGTEVFGFNLVMLCGLCTKPPPVPVRAPRAAAGSPVLGSLGPGVTPESEEFRELLESVAAKLGLTAPVRLRRLIDEVGANNAGVWKLSSASPGSFLLKVVSDSEASDLGDVLVKFPGIAQDRRLVLPFAIYPIVTECEPAYSVQISQFVENATSLADLMFQHWTHHRPDLLSNLIISFGSFLARFQRDFSGGLSHNDLTPSNVLVITDPRGRPEFFLIDCMGLDMEGDDAASFLRSVDMLSLVYGEHFRSVVTEAFGAGYSCPISP